MRVIGYTRVSTEEQADSGAGLEVQRQAIRDEVVRRGWELADMVEDPGFSAKNMRRPGVQRALGMLDRGEAASLVVSKLDRLSRSMLDFTTVCETARKGGWMIVSLDCGVDMSTPAGEMMVNVLASFAQFERRLIGQRTKDGLAVKRAQGVRLGRPPVLPAELRAQIREHRENGVPFAGIAAALNTAGVPTAQGGRCWYPSTVRAAAQVSA